jgi:1,4-dihydroxy-2-naphthoate octaprenyltransferase
MPEPAHAEDAPSTYAGALVQAARPRTLPAAATPVLVGTAIAVWGGAFEPVAAGVALACALLIQVGTNFANDYFDYRKGADTEDRVGETRVTQAGLAEPEQVKRWMVAAFGLAVLMGVYLVVVGGWPILAVGLASVAAAILYTGGPWPYGYHGLGDPFVFAFFGLVAVAGTHFVQAPSWSVDALVAGAGVGAMTTNILVVNNLRDVDTDRAAGKRTLAVILGPTGARAEYLGLLLGALAVPAVGAAALGWPRPTLLALGAVFLAARPAWTVLTTDDPEVLDAQLAPTARALLVYGLLLAGGFLL